MVGTILYIIKRAFKLHNIKLNYIYANERVSMLFLTLLAMFQATLISENQNIVKIDRLSRHWEKMDECAESTIIANNSRQRRRLIEPRRRPCIEPRRGCAPVYNGSCGTRGREFNDVRGSNW